MDLVVHRRHSEPCEPPSHRLRAAPTSSPTRRPLGLPTGKARGGAPDCIRMGRSRRARRSSSTTRTTPSTAATLWIRASGREAVIWSVESLNVCCHNRDHGQSEIGSKPPPRGPPGNQTALLARPLPFPPCWRLPLPLHSWAWALGRHGATTRSTPCVTTCRP